MVGRRAVFVGLSFAFSSFAFAFACGLGVTGTGQPPSDRAPDATPFPDVALPPVGDASPPDDDAGGDAGAADACAAPGAINADGSRTAFAIPSTKPKTIDGDLGDFTGCPALVLDVGSKAFQGGSEPDAGVARATYQLEWDDGGLYVGVDVLTNGPPQGSSPTALYDNDSVSLFFSGDPAGRTGAYRPGTDLHITVDWNDQALDFTTDVGSGQTLPAGVVAASTSTATGYRVEALVGASAIGVTGALAAPQPIVFDTQLNIGLAQATYFVWADEPHGACPLPQCMTPACTCNDGSGDHLPTYDTMLLAPITLK